MPQIDINNPNTPGIFPEIDINRIPSIRDIGKKPTQKDDDTDKPPPEKYRCPYCGGFH